MATQTKNKTRLLRADFNPRQEMEALQRLWSIVDDEGVWKVLPTTTVTAAESGGSVDIFPYLGRTGAEVFSIVERKGVGVSHQRLDFTRVPALFGAKVSLDAFEVNRQGMMNYTQKLRRPLGRKILTLDTDQTIKIISKDVEPQIPAGKTALLVSLALRSPEEYEGAFTVDTVRRTVDFYTEQFAAAAVHQTVDFPLARYTHVPFPTTISGSVA